MSFIVVYDACVLHPAPLRDLLLRIAESGLVRARWSDEILDEVFVSVLQRRPDLDPARLARTRRAMCEAVEDSVVTDYAGLADQVQLPDPGDRHVVAAAIRCGAQAIVTANLKDFPRAALEPLGIEAVHPDDFVVDLLDLAPGAILRLLLEQAAALKNPPVTPEALLVTLERNGLARAVAELRILLGFNPPTAR